MSDGMFQQNSLTEHAIESFNIFLWFAVFTVHGRVCNIGTNHWELAII